MVKCCTRTGYVLLEHLLYRLLHNNCTPKSGGIFCVHCSKLCSPVSYKLCLTICAVIALPLS